MKSLSLIFICLFIQSCLEGRKNKDLRVDSLRYYEYWWTPIDSTFITEEIYINQFLEIDKKGNVRGYHKSYAGNDKYLSEKVNSNTAQLIDSIFSDKKSSSTLTYTDTTIYCGPSYLFAYVIDSKRYFLKFIPGLLPQDIRTLYEELSSTTIQKTNYDDPIFDISSCKAELLGIDTLLHPRPKVEYIEFSHPVVN